MDTGTSGTTPRIFVVYTVMLLGAVGLFLVFRAFGETLVAPPATTPVAVGATTAPAQQV